MIYYSSNNFYFMNEVVRGHLILLGAFDSDMKCINAEIYKQKRNKMSYQKCPFPSRLKKRKET